MTIEAIRQHKARNSTSLVLKRFQAAELLPEDFSRAPDGVFPDDDNDEGGEEHAAGLEHVGPDDSLQAADSRVENANLEQNGWPQWLVPIEMKKNPLIKTQSSSKVANHATNSDSKAFKLLINLYH